MASPPAPENLGGPSGGKQEPEPPKQEGNGLQKPTGKEKKKVGFASHGQERSGDGLPSIALTTPDPDQSGAAQDYFSFSPRTGTNSGSTPIDQQQSPLDRNSVNNEELAAALAEILRPEDHGGPVPHSRPRPVLRKSTAYNNPSEQLNEPTPGLLEAKRRADRLAYDLGSSPAPGSGWTTPGGFASGLETPNDAAESLGGTGFQTVNAQDFALPQDATGLRPRKVAQQAANDIVRTHTRRVSRFAQLQPPTDGDPTSGTATPVAHDLEYVPRPVNYKGGILGSLLKLYHSAEDSQNGEYSTLSTPSRTPNRTPASSPPTSRPNTPLSEKPPRTGLGAGLRGAKSHSSRGSSSTLAGLMGSSLAFAAPGMGSKDMSEVMSEKVKEREREKTRKAKHSRSKSNKQKLDEFRITVHIAEILSRHQYLLKLCRALMMYGAPTHRLEAYMSMSSRVLGIESQYSYFPGTMFVAFDDRNTHTTEFKIVRVAQGVDLGRLRDVHEIYKEVVHDLIGVEEATARLEEVMARKDKYPLWFRILVYGLASATVAPFGFDGRYIDMPIAFILGCLVGALQLVLAPSNELYANVFEITAAIATSFLSRAFGSIHDGTLFCFSTLAQSSIALILPGYIVLCASLELQSHQMVSGSVRMVYALIYSLFLGYGITIGSVVYGWIDENAVSAVTCSAYPEHWYTQKPHSGLYLLFVLPFTLCLCAINQAKWKQTPVMLVIALAGYCVNSYSVKYFQGNTTVSSTLGALCIGVLANLHSRLGRYVENWWLDKQERYVDPPVRRVRRFLSRKFNKRSSHHRSSSRNRSWRRHDDPGLSDTDDGGDDIEQGHGPRSNISVNIAHHARKIGYGLAAAAMLPAIWVQVPSGLAVRGSLLSGVTSADQITRNETLLANGTLANTTTVTVASGTDPMDSTAFNVLFSVIQVAISISVGLSLSALIVYPFGKRRSGLFSL